MGLKSNNLVEDKVGGISAIDEFLSSDDVFLQDFNKSRKKLTEFLKAIIRHHINSNPYYADYCKRMNFNIEEDEFDLNKIPLLPSAIFKNDLKFVQSNWDDSVMLTTSSGTKGTVSQVPRDNTTLMRFFASVAAGVQEVFEIPQSNLDLYCLSPKLEEIKHLWISYVITGVSLYFPSKFYVSNDEFKVEQLVSDLRKVDQDKNGKKIVIIGPPALVLDTTKELAKTGNLNLLDRCLIVTMGGWKSRQGDIVERKELTQRIVEAFGLLNEEYVRDVYNMVELNTVIFECKHHKKHCPPWLYARARNPQNLTVQASGELGILSFADPTAVSYPGFVLSDDFGVVHEQVKCTCGIVSDIIEIKRRVNKLESRGCALKI
ncbi:LuxE/PaaK family acyltransferase [Aureispira anguillae]|uniref:Acyl-protein synthetase LuxE domain-containing protein n=1 Tax=Aureispira anguillae TaxID=2864201 RepID=A0A915YED6_9BACT|nr:hypothetical protein [Aureispira anguillae]BDS11582.1 hypothetical protein AsAng_0022960 [Aureispira anguillae]